MGTQCSHHFVAGTLRPHCLQPCAAPIVRSEQCESIYTPAAAASLVFLLAGVVSVLMLRDDNRRGDAEKAWAASKVKGRCDALMRSEPVEGTLIPNTCGSTSGHCTARIASRRCASAQG